MALENLYVFSTQYIWVLSGLSEKVIENLTLSPCSNKGKTDKLFEKAILPPLLLWFITIDVAAMYSF